MKTIDAQTYLREQAHQQRVIDVRSPAEFRAGHVLGSENIPLDEIQAGHVPHLQNGEQVTLVCLSGKRSGMACELLAEKLGGQVTTVDGGITALEQAGVVLKRDAGASAVWSMERQVRAVAGLLVVSGAVLSHWLPSAVWLSGFVGTGLLYSAISDSCAMASVLSKMPWNK